MLSFVQLNLMLLLLLSTALVAVEPYPMARSDAFCPQTGLDEDYPLSEVRYRGILIENASDLDANENSLYIADDSDPDSDGPYDEQSDEDRSAQEWKKVRRYIKRQLKVPRRYLKKFVRKLTVASGLRSIDEEELPAITNEMNVVLARANGDFDARRLMVVDSPEYFAVVTAPTAYA